MDLSGKVQLKVVKLSISEDDEPSNKHNWIGLTNKVVVILLLATKSESKKQWVEPESIKVFTGIDWLVFGIEAERDNTSEEETEAADTGGKNAFIQGLHGDYIVIF